MKVDSPGYVWPELAESIMAGVDRYGDEGVRELAE